LALCFAALASPAFAVNLVTNGNFSTIAAGDTTSADYDVINQYLVGSAYGTGLPDWTVAGSNGNALVCLIDYSQNTSNTNLCGTQFGGGLSLWVMPGASPVGGNYMMIDAVPAYNGALQQTINGLNSGSNYTLTFYEATGQQSGFQAPSGMTQQFSVSLGSQTINAPLLNTPNNGSDGWAQVSMTFTANSSSELLSFVANGTPAGEPPMIMLDGVSLTQSLGQGSAPEPGTYAMVGMGLLTLGWGMRKRRAQVAPAKLPVTL
jgi:hypothetical protein